MNNWNFTGNLGRDAEQRFSQSGNSVVSFSVGVKAGFGDKATTTWANCSMFGKRGEAIVSYLKKGSLVGVCGEVNMRDWSDKDGNKRQSLDVIVNDLTLLGGKSEASSAPRSEPSQTKKDSKPGSFDDMNDDIPF